MSQDEREELLPCPFCGSKEIATTWVRPTDECQWWGVCCMDCKAEINSVTHDRAVEAWNTRPTAKGRAMQ